MEVPLFKVFMSPEAGPKVQETLYSGYIGQGPVVEQFEKRLGDWFNNPNVLTVNSGTSSLQLALHLAGGGGVVLTTPLTCFATTAAILATGHEPMWVDVDPATCNMDLRDLKRKIKECNPSAIMVVHYAGYPVDLEALHEIADGIPVIEDCAHALGSYTPKGHVGTQYNNYGCFSFQAIKTLTTGDGGAIVLPEWQYERAKKLRWFGLHRDVPRTSQNIDEPGFKYHMNDIAASIGLANMAHTSRLLSQQRDNLLYYRSQFPELFLDYKSSFQSSGWLCPLQVGSAKQFDKAMLERGIQTGLGHDRNDRHVCLDRHRRHLPGMTWVEESISCIPSGWWVWNKEREYIADCIKKGW